MVAECVGGLLDEKKIVWEILDKGSKFSVREDDVKR